MRRILTGLTAGLLLAGVGCRHCCGDRPRLFDDTRNREPDCRENCPPTGRASSAPRLGTPLRGQEVGLSGGTTAYPMLPTYTAPMTPFAPRSGPTDFSPADLLPTPSTIPPTDVPLSPTMPAVPSGALLPAPSIRPAGR